MIDNIYRSNKQLNNEIRLLENRISSLLPVNITEEFYKFQNIKISKYFHEHKSKLQNKFETLIKNAEPARNTLTILLASLLLC